MLLTVNSLTTNAPNPLPSKISGTESVNANAPSTPSKEKVVSIIIRKKTLLASERLLSDLSSSRSCFSAFSLKPWVKKKAVDPTTAPKAIIDSTLSANQTITASSTETTAKNQTPCF